MTTSPAAEWNPQYPDQEDLLATLIQSWLDELAPAGESCTWLPKGFIDEVDAGKVYVRVHRLGGRVDGIVDTSTIQVGVIAKTRRESWRVYGVIRDRLLEFAPDDVAGVPIADIVESTGPVQIIDPALNPDHRFVPGNFQVSCRKLR